MYLKHLVFLFLTVHSVYVKGKVITVKVDPKQIVNTLRTVFTAEYLDRLADIIARKAATSFVVELSKNLPQIRGTKFQSKAVQTTETDNNRNDVNIMDNREAEQLLETPGPDGDNLDTTSRGLSREQSDINRMPVLGLMKINGKYFRRFLGVI